MIPIGGGGGGAPRFEQRRSVDQLVGVEIAILGSIDGADGVGRVDRVADGVGSGLAPRASLAKGRDQRLNTQLGRELSVYVRSERIRGCGPDWMKAVLQLQLCWPTESPEVVQFKLEARSQSLMRR